MSTGELLNIQPEELQFPFELNKLISCSLQLSNKTENYVAFKVKTTDPKKYCIRPHTGIVLPMSTCDVIVKMQAQKEAPIDMQCEDKFLISSVVAAPRATAKDIALEMFNKESGHYVEECKLRVVYVAPSRSPSPVQEGAEVDFSPCASVSDSGHRNASEYAETRADVISRLPAEKSSAQQNNKLQQELWWKNYRQHFQLLSDITNRIALACSVQTTEAVLKTEVSKLSPVFKESSDHEVSKSLNYGLFADQEEEAAPVKKKGKYIWRTSSKTDNNLLTKSAKSRKSSKNNPLEVIKGTTKANEECDANSPKQTDKHVEQNLPLSKPNPHVGSHEYTPLISTYEQDATVSFKESRDNPENANDVDDKFGQALDLKWEGANNQGHMDVDGDYDFFENLESVLSGSSFSLGCGTDGAPLSDTRQEEINKAVEGLGDLLAKKLEDIFDKPEEKATFENIITLLEAANEKEISIGLKHFIPYLKESAAFIFNQFSKYVADVKAFSALEAEKHELHQLGQEGKKEKQEIDVEISKTKAVVDSCSAEISSLEQQISNLHRRLEETKSRYRDSSQQCLMLQTKKKIILEKAKGLLERGKKIMETKTVFHIKHDEALLQQATLKEQWTSLQGTFLKYQSKYQN